ncbi:PA3715 family protein [Pseudomonas sp. Marseille-Q8238]
MRIVPRLLLAGITLSAGLVQAQDCREQLPQVLQATYGAAHGVQLDDVQCKVWPARPELTLIAVPVPQVKNEGYGETDLEVLVTDSASGQLRARRLEKHLLDWDAVYVSALILDTAPYRVRADQLAFAVRVERRVNSRATLFSERFLMLYALEDGQLRPLLERMVMETLQGESDTNCASQWSEVKRTLAVAEKPGRYGYRDLILREQVEANRTEAHGDDCDKVEQRHSQQTYRLVYDGQRYPVPDALRAIQ